ncbi:MAG TPA: dihydrofolate reductase [Bacteroidia bacterium]|nr:dihydrofolate reductase [Bacteroidia bacterium]HNP98082.1 dihydrofolate reductase [Bacteroidia bacterium]
MSLSIIVALSENNVVGVNNQLPWKLSADLKRVKGLTMGHHIIMGRKTYESIGRPLPGRVNVVISGNPEYKAEGCKIVASLSEALDLAMNDSEVFIFGGGVVFREALSKVNKIYMTKVHHVLDGDTHFPLLNPKEWKETERMEFKADEKNEYDYSFITLERV